VSTETPKLKLSKPTEGDMDWAAEINRNWDVLDNALVVKGDLSEHNGKVLTIVDSKPTFAGAAPGNVYAFVGLALVVLLVVDVVLHVLVLRKLARAAGARNNRSTPPEEAA